MFKNRVYYEAPDDLGGGDPMDQLATLLAGADPKEPEPEQEPESDPAPQDPEPSDPPQQEPAAPKEPTKPEPEKDPQKKMNYAFGQLRQEANNYKNLLERLAKANGIEFTDERDLMQKLNDQALEGLSKRDKVPVEMLRRLEQLEQNNLAYQAQQRQSQVMVEFQKLADNYGLDQDGLIAFAKELDDNGKNPFTSDVNIEDAYRLMHYDEILEAKVTAAVEAALKKSSVADKHSTTPAAKQGKPDTGVGEKISTVDQLSDLLNGVKLN